MVNPNTIDMNKLSKKFIDGSLGAYGKDLFTFALTSGSNLDSFATTPQIMKSIAIWMTKMIKNYENQFGSIDMNPPSIISPIQITDLGGSKTK